MRATSSSCSDASPPPLPINAHARHRLHVPAFVISDFSSAQTQHRNYLRRLIPKSVGRLGAVLVFLVGEGDARHELARLDL